MHTRHSRHERGRRHTGSTCRRQHGKRGLASIQRGWERQSNIAQKGKEEVKGKAYGSGIYRHGEVSARRQSCALLSMLQVLRQV